MNIRTRLGVIGVLAVSLTPEIVQAKTEREALEACVRAMTAELGKEQGAPIAYQIDDKSDSDEKRLYYTTVFYLDATDSQNGEVVARMDCQVGADAVVQRLKTLPLNARNALNRRRS